MTVGKWVRRYGKDHLLGKVIVVMKADEQTEVKELRKRVRELEKVLADAHIDAIRLSLHAHQEMVEDAISCDQVREVLRGPRVIENYPNHQRGPCCLARGQAVLRRRPCTCPPGGAAGPPLDD
jgi:hypothetical protein